MTDGEVERLGTHGWFERDDFAGTLGASVIAKARAHDGKFVRAGLGRDHHLDASVRGDELLWVDHDDVELAPLVESFTALRLELNASAWLGLTRFELQLAHYPGAGTHYARHTDEAGHRRVTAIVYLNPSWMPAHGGARSVQVERSRDRVKRGPGPRLRSG